MSDPTTPSPLHVTTLGDIQRAGQRTTSWLELYGVKQPAVKPGAPVEQSLADLQAEQQKSSTWMDVFGGPPSRW